MPNKAPTIVGDPIIKQSGEAVHMICVMEACPKPQIRWTRDEEPIADGGSYLLKMDDHGPNKYKACCQILCFRADLGGLYKCTASNSEGKVFSTFTVGSESKNVPEFLDKPLIVKRENGTVLRLKFKAKSATPVTATWQKNDEPIRESDRIKFLKADEQENEYTFMLEIKNVSKEDEADYKCIARNADGACSQSLELSFE